MIRPEQQRTDMLRAVEVICDAWDAASLDARAAGFPATGDAGGSTGHDPTALAALNARVAQVWIARVKALIDSLYHQADLALRNWPSVPAAGAVIDGISIGQRGNQAEQCWLCGLPATSGRDDKGRVLIHRVSVGDNLVTLHNTAVADRPACYWILDRKARSAGQSIAGYITANAATA